MRVTLTVDLDPAMVTELTAALQARGLPLMVRAPTELPTSGCAPLLPDPTTIRTLLTIYGLTPRQCDLVLLDVQGYTRADIAARCGISPATVKKYWAAIYARLGIQRRQALRAWLLAQCHSHDLITAPGYHLARLEG